MSGRLTLVLGEYVSAEGGVVVLGAAGGALAQVARLDGGQRADAQGQRGQSKRSLHVRQLKGCCCLFVQVQDLITCAQTCQEKHTYTQTVKCTHP